MQRIIKSEKLEEYYSVVFEKELLDEIAEVGTYKKVKENA